MYSRREKNRQLSACSSTSRSRPTFPIASGRITHIWRHVAGGDRLVQDDELGSGSSLHRCIAASLVRSFVRSFVLLRRVASSWSTTRDCAVITAACGRKHVGTRGRGGSSAFVRIRGCAHAYVCRRCIVCVRARNVPWESISPCKGKEKEGWKDEERHTKAIHPECGAASLPINPFFFRVFPPTWLRGRRFTTLRGNRCPSIVNSVDRPTSTIVLSRED